MANYVPICGGEEAFEPRAALMLLAVYGIGSGVGCALS